LLIRNQQAILKCPAFVAIAPEFLRKCFAANNRKCIHLTEKIAQNLAENRQIPSKTASLAKPLPN
jgi:hypothetical protein